MRNAIIMLILVCFSCYGNAQIRTSVNGGAQFSLINSVSDFDVSSSYRARPGAFLAYSVYPKNNLQCELMLEYTRIKAGKGVPLADLRGNAAGRVNAVFRERSIQLAFLFIKKIGKLEVKTGLMPQFKTISEIKYKNSKVLQNTPVESNNSVRRINISIPVQLEYPFVNDINLLVRYERALINRLYNGQGGVKEFENDFKFGLAYYFD